jgi:phosphoserine phosphatase
VFVTELLTDISHATLPLENIKSTLAGTMNEVGIQTLFQTEDVFNKEKRMLLFDIGSSFIDPELHAEIREQTGLTAGDVTAAYPHNHVAESLKKATALLEGFPAEVLHTIIEHIRPTDGTLELLQTLRIMGYRIALLTTGFSVFTDAIKTRLGIDYVYGYPLQIDDDARAVVGEVPPGGFAERDLHAVIDELTTAEDIRPDNVSIIADDGRDRAPGIRLTFDLEQILAYYNNKVLSRDALLGLLGSFGIPRTGDSRK